MMMSTSGPYYSQFREDRLLERMFPEGPGVCVDVGAHDGITGSNSYLFERRGWRCILVEPVPELCERIRTFRRAIVVNCAASSSTGAASFYVPRSLESWSALELAGTRKKQLTSGETGVDAITVQTRTLDDILEDAGVSAVDFVSIDVEGHELAVLKGLSIDRFAPRVVIVEDNSGEGENGVAAHLAARGYIRFLRTGVNDWYGRETDRLLQPESISKWRILLKRWQFEDQVKRRFVFLDGILPASVKSCLARILHHASRILA
jgi:FkbM family methyltransferase